MILLKSLATPLVWVSVLLVSGLVLTRPARRRRLLRIGRWLLLAATVLLLVLSLKPVAEPLAYSLECQYRSPPPETLKGLDIIVVLGCGVYPSGGLRQEAEISREAYPRLYHGVVCFKDSGAGVLALCGGVPRGGVESEAEVMRRMAMQLGVPEDRIVAETSSRNTMQNAANSAKLLLGRQRRIGLVTSATHMPRSRKVFEKQFPRDQIVPVPVYYTYDFVGWSPENLIPSSDSLEKSSIALHEWIGLAWYALRY
jgi:uncharacterized SAM-binding protein YcdF (DUF218 family)